MSADYRPCKGDAFHRKPHTRALACYACAEKAPGGKCIGNDLTDQRALIHEPGVVLKGVDRWWEVGTE